MATKKNKKIEDKIIDEIVAGNINVGWRTHVNNNLYSVKIVELITNSLLSFCVATQFKYKSIDEIYNSTDVWTIENDKQTTIELFELIAFNVLSRNTCLSPMLNSIFLDNIKGTINNQLHELHDRFKSSLHTSDIFQHLSNYTDEYSKKELGGVQTPYDLVTEIINKIEINDSTNTVLDMAGGVGTFIFKMKTLYPGLDYYYNDIDLIKCYISNGILNNDINNKTVKIYCSNFLEVFEKVSNKPKFDVIIGNPPFQTGSGERGGKHSLWRHFVKLSFKLIAKDGIVAIICPGYPNEAKDLKSNFNDNTPIYLNNNVTNHFKDIDVLIKYWIVMQGKHNKSFVVDGVKRSNSNIKYAYTMDLEFVNILEKTQKHKNFICQHDKIYGSTQLKNDNTDYFSEPTVDCIYPIRHASKVEVAYVKKQTKCFFERKVMMTFSGYPNFKYYDENNPIGSCHQMSGYILVNDQLEGDALISLYNLKLYKLLSTYGTGAGMKGCESYTLPYVDLSKKWTNDKLYKYFNLTAEEIQYIEDTIK